MELVLIIFPLSLQSKIIAQTPPTGGEENDLQRTLTYLLCKVRAVYLPVTDSAVQKAETLVVFSAHLIHVSQTVCAPRVTAVQLQRLHQPHVPSSS